MQSRAMTTTPLPRPVLTVTSGSAVNAAGFSVSDSSDDDGVTTAAASGDGSDRNKLYHQAMHTVLSSCSIPSSRSKTEEGRGKKDEVRCGWARRMRMR
jgi:hypothetical protein